MRNTKFKTYAFIDSQNLNMGVYKKYHVKLDFAKLRKYLKDKYNVEKAYLFIGYTDKNISLYQKLQEAGYILILKPTLLINHKKSKEKKIKGNVDADLVLHTMIQLKNFQKAIIVSGDGDFYCLVEFLEKKRKLLKIIVPNDSYSSLIRKYARYILSVKLFLKKVV